ncbi:MAG: TIGR02679 family protein [Acidobacteriota bacterium]
MRSQRDRLRSILSRPELKRLIDRLRRRIESGRGLEGTVTLASPSDSERRAVDRLLGRPLSRGRSVRVPLAELEAQLEHAGFAGGLREAMEALTGPLTDRQAQRQRLEHAWQQLLADAEQRDPRPRVREWLAARRTRTLLRRYSGQSPERGERLLGTALEVLSRLPSRGRLLAELAAETCADSHALDAGRPLGNLVVDAVARLGGIDDWHGAENHQQVWAAVGVAKDDVSASVLCFNVPTVGDRLCDQLLADCLAHKEPCRLTTGQLYRHPPTFAAHLVDAFVVENPAILAAARRLGASCAPLICTDGQPAVAVHALLTRLVEHGTTLHYHGDFDWPGIRIFDRLLRRYPIKPWRYSATDYRMAPAGVELTGKPAATPWDPALHDAMVERECAVHEEQVVDRLLSDLTR